MAFDGIVTCAVVQELNRTILGGKINRVTQPERDEIVLQIYANQKNFRVLLSANPENARINLTEINRENPMTAPNFCMVLRKHLVGAAITSVKQVKFDRIVEFGIEGVNDLGDAFKERLIVEIMGRRSNIVLVNETGVILDAIKHIGSEMNSFREVMPARVYAAPPAQDKKMPCEILDTTVFDSEKSIMEGIMGFSKPVAKVAFERGLLEDFLRDILCGDYKPFVYSDFSDFHVLSGASDGREVKLYSSVSEALEAFYEGRDVISRARNLKANVCKVVSGNILRVNRKINILREDIGKSENYDEYRVKGDLLASNMHLVNDGESEIRCTDYYDPELREISIPLDPHKNAAWNLKNYYRLYRKNKSKFENSLENLSKAEDELRYLLSVDSALSAANDSSTIDEIKQELAAGGYMKLVSEKNKKRPPVVKTPGYIVTKTSDGYTVWIGKNNVQNDLLTTKLAFSNDLWLHVKNVPGSHVILRTSEQGGKYTETALREAATLAGMNSSLRDAHRADVDFTYVKHVKKPSGARPGMVIFTDNKTITVDF